MSSDLYKMEPILSDIYEVKWIAAIVLFFGSMFCGLFPHVYVFNFRKDVSKISGYSDLLLPYFLRLSAGVLFGASIVHSTREVRPVLSAIQVGIPITETLICVGFLFVYVMEEILRLALDSFPETIPMVTNSLPPEDIFPPHNDMQNLPKDEECQRSTEDLSDQKNKHLPELPSEIEENKNSDFQSLEKHSVLLPEYDVEDKHPDLQSILHSTNTYPASSFTSPASSSFLHSVIAGLNIGLESSVAGVLYMLGAVGIHQIIIAFCLGMEMILSKKEDDRPILSKSMSFIAILTVSSVLGVLGGNMITISGFGEEGNLACAMMQTIAAGALLYIALLEIMPQQHSRCQQIGLHHFLTVILGFSMSLAFEYSIPAAEI